jgi:hypothetical protein
LEEAGKLRANESASNEASAMHITYNQCCMLALGSFQYVRIPEHLDVLLAETINIAQPYSNISGSFYMLWKGSIEGGKGWKGSL